VAGYGRFLFEAQPERAQGGHTVGSAHMQLEGFDSSRPGPRSLWLNRWVDRATRPWPAILAYLDPGPPAAEAKRAEMEDQIQRDLKSLRERARGRSYPDTMNVLAFYWLMTVRETYTAEHWPILGKQARMELSGAGSLSEEEARALGQAARWIDTTLPCSRKAVLRRNFVPPFTSGQYAPPDFISQAFLETLLNEWLRERVLEKYGRRLIPADWNSESAYEETALCLEEILKPLFIFPDVETVHAMDRLQGHRPTPIEDILQWRRRRQAGLESLLLVSLREANTIDPKQREILTDVVLYMLGVTGPPPEPEAGYAWLLPAPLGDSLPKDAAKQVAEFPLPRDYAGATTLLIPFEEWQVPGRSNGSLQPLSIESTLLTPDGRIWQSHDLEQEAGSAPGILYCAAGKIDVVPTSRGLLLQVPIASCPTEINPKLIEEWDMALYHGRWHMERMEATHDGACVTYRRISEPAAGAVRAQKKPGAELACEPRQARRWQRPKAS
jgi:hypothetical protein